MTAAAPAPPPFYRIGPERLASPVVLSVPHAGRAYSADLLRAARVPLSVLEALEDRLVDRLVWRAVAGGATAIVASAPRAEIDLNRDERELDPAMVAPPPPSADLLASVRTRGGLGLVPSRLAGAGGLWRGRMSRDELNRRVETIHRPYHAAVAEALAAARRQFGAAMLLDCHSMPPRAEGQAGSPVIFGDRYGATIAPELKSAALAAARLLGFSVRAATILMRAVMSSSATVGRASASTRSSWRSTAAFIWTRRCGRRGRASTGPPGWSRRSATLWRAPSGGATGCRSRPSEHPQRKMTTAWVARGGQVQGGAPSKGRSAPPQRGGATACQS
jgi:N-formylglutamate amidohydrolase